MPIRLAVLLVVLPAGAHAQSDVPPDINPVTLSRLPPPTPELLDDAGRERLAARPDYVAGPGPTQFGVYNAPDGDLGIPSGVRSPVGARYFQLSVLIVAREIDQEYEWSSHAVARRGKAAISIRVVPRGSRPAESRMGRRLTLAPANVSYPPVVTIDVLHAVVSSAPDASPDVRVRSPAAPLLAGFKQRSTLAEGFRAPLAYAIPCAHDASRRPRRSAVT